MSYGKISRRISEKARAGYLTGRKISEYRVNTPNIDPFVLAQYVSRRSPKSRVMFDLGKMSEVRIVVYTEYE